MLILALVAAALATLGHVATSRGDLQSQAQSLRQGAGADAAKIAGYQGRLSDLRVRLSGLESSLETQLGQQRRLHGQLMAARTRLGNLRTWLTRARRVLEAQLVSQYESPAPDITAVVLQSNGFTNLLEQVSNLRQLARGNAQAMTTVLRVRALVQTEAQRLAVAEAQQRRVVSAVLVERDQIANLKLAVLERERATRGDRARKLAELARVRGEIAVLNARAVAAQRASFQGPASQAAAPPPAPSGDYGFFPAGGTNYSVGEEPTIAARLNKLGQALGLHLIGISGYRSPQHSMEVGGFADDPHTRGEASDTPGVEGVPEATLLRFGLTRPFPGAREADHIQLS